MPEEVWETELEGEEFFEQVGQEDATSAPASPDAAFDMTATELPPPAVLPAPKSLPSTLPPAKNSPQKGTARAPTKTSPSAAGSATGANVSAPATPKSASAYTPVAASPFSTAAAASRSASLAQLAREPMNNANVLLGMTLGFQLLALLLYI